MNDKEHIVISLGGSLIIPDEIDTAFLSSFVKMIKEYTAKGSRFVLITGGGKVCRKYNSAAEAIMNPSKDDLDWIGIATTRLNAEFVRVLLGDDACPQIIFTPEIMPTTDKPVLIGGGWKPGNSSDLAAVITAKTINAKIVINLSNIDYVYNKDPRKFSDAVKIEKATWPEFRAILPKDWDPGLSSPFDPIAAKEAEALGLEVAIMDGKNIENLRNYLDGKAFIGTVVK